MVKGLKIGHSIFGKEGEKKLLLCEAPKCGSSKMKGKEMDLWIDCIG